MNIPIWQNLAAFELSINPSNKRFYFDNSLVNKKIQSLFLYFCTEDAAIHSPFDKTENVANLSDWELFSIYVNLTNKSGKQICKNFSSNYLTRCTADAFYQGKSTGESRYFLELKIDDYINVDKSFISVFNSDYTGKIILYVNYTNTPITLTDNIITNAFTVQFPTVDTDTDIILSDYVNNTLRGKKIKKIEAVYNPDDPGAAGIFSYLYLKCKKNKIFEYLPVTSLVDFSKTKSILFDNIEPIFEESSLLYRGISDNMNLKLIFYY